MPGLLSQNLCVCTHVNAYSYALQAGVPLSCQGHVLFQSPTNEYLSILCVMSSGGASRRTGRR
jgi:hypothetical protein